MINTRTRDGYTFSEQDSTSMPELGRTELRMYDCDRQWAGFATFDYRDKSLLLKNINLFEQYRGQGLSKLFFNQLLELASRQGLEGVELGTSIQHPNMARTLKHFFPSQTRDEIITKSKERSLGVIACNSVKKVN